MKAIETTWVYSHFCAAGELLYVGVSKDILARTRTHEKSAGWFHEVRRIDVQIFDSRELALAAEAEQIVSLRPKYNKYAIVNGRYVRVGKGDELRAAYLTMRPNIIKEVERIGLKNAVLAMGVSDLSLFRICTDESSTPMQSTVTKLADYFRERAGK